MFADNTHSTDITLQEQGTTNESSEQSVSLIGYYMSIRDELFRPWGWETQQRSNDLLYIATGVSKPNTDEVGRSIITFVTYLGYSLGKARESEESLEHLDLFIGIVHLIDHPLSKNGVELLKSIKQRLLEMRTQPRIGEADPLLSD